MAFCYCLLSDTGQIAIGGKYGWHCVLDDDDFQNTFFTEAGRAFLYAQVYPGGGCCSLVANHKSKSLHGPALKRKRVIHFNIEADRSMASIHGDFFPLSY